MFLVASGGTDALRDLDSLVCADSLSFKTETFGDGTAEIAKFSESPTPIALTDNDQLSVPEFFDEFAYAFSIDRFHRVNTVESDDRGGRVCEIVAGPFSGERFYTSNFYKPSHVWKQNLQVRNIDDTALAGSRVVWTSLADHSKIIDPRACPFAFFDLVPGKDHFLAVQNAGNVYSIAETISPMSIVPNHVESYKSVKLYLEKHDSPVNRIMSGLYRGIREFSIKSGGLEQRNSYIEAIKTKINGLRARIKGWEERIRCEATNFTNACASNMDQEKYQAETDKFQKSRAHFVNVRGFLGSLFFTFFLKSYSHFFLVKNITAHRPASTGHTPPRITAQVIGAFALRLTKFAMICSCTPSAVNSATYLEKMKKKTLRERKEK